MLYWESLERASWRHRSSSQELLDPLESFQTFDWLFIWKLSIVFQLIELGELCSRPRYGPPITVRKGVHRRPIRFSFFAAAAVTTTFVWLLTPLRVICGFERCFFSRQDYKQCVECLAASFTVPRSTINESLRARKGAWSKDEFRRTIQRQKLLKP